MRGVVGVVALQGAFQEHIDKFAQLGVDAVQIKTPQDLARPELVALVLPGGESTAMASIAERWGLLDPLREWVRADRPIWGTCAGMVLLADYVEDRSKPHLGGLALRVARNRYGSQVHSFVSALHTIEPRLEVKGVFIRAPVVTEFDSDKIQVLATLPDSEIPVAVRQGNRIATAFHPELSESVCWHHWFAELAGVHTCL